MNLMSPAYWIYLAMAATILLNAIGAYSRFRLWRIDANRGILEARLRVLAIPAWSNSRARRPALKASRESKSGRFVPRRSSRRRKIERRRKT